MARRRMSMAKFNSMVRKAMGRKTLKHIRIVATPTASANNLYTLLSADDDPDYDLISDGTNIAECSSLAKITNIKLSVSIYDSTGAGLVGELLLYKDPDNAFGTVTPSTLFTARDISAGNFYGQLAKYTMKYWGWIFPSNFNNFSTKAFVKRQALKRAGLMRDGDRLKLVYAAPGGTTHNILITGTISVMEP